MLSIETYVLIAIVCLLDLSGADFYNSTGFSAYTWPGNYPQSCLCAENGVRRDNCNLFKCGCICDVTAGKCDYNCCCDPDCSAEQVGRFNQLGVCSIETYSTSSVNLCYSSVQLSKVNPRTPLGEGITIRAAVGDALCVVKQNNVLESDYYQDTELQPSSIFAESTGEKDFDYTQGRPSQVTVDSNYDQNDTIAAFTNTSLYGLVASGSGYFQVPLSDFSGKCNQNNNVKFENEIGKNTCIQDVSYETLGGFKNSCEKGFSVEKYVNNLFIARFANVRADAGYATSSSVVGVTLSSIKFSEYATGIVTDVTSSYSAQQCSTKAYQSVTTYLKSKSACLFPKSFPPFSSRNNTVICQGFVKSVDYTVTHLATSSGIISSVSAAVIITDVPIHTGSNTANSAGLSSTVSVMQSFSVAFTSGDASQTNNVNGNVVKRSRSGNPGYLQGLPVLYGHRVSSSSAIKINEVIGGLTMRGPSTSYDVSRPKDFGKSMCPSSPSLSAQGSIGVDFGYDVTSGCMLSLNRAEFESLCCTGASSCTASKLSSSSFSDALTGLPYFLNVTSGYVGTYGNADPLDVQQWQQLAVSVPTPTRRFDPRTGICSNMFTGLNYKFLYAKSGELHNPQNKIVAALAEVTVGDLSLRIPVGDNTTLQSFPLLITVSFIQTSNQSLKGYSPPAPPVLFQVPYDVFYPFYQSSTAASNAQYSFLSLGFFLSSILLMYFLL